MKRYSVDIGSKTWLFRIYTNSLRKAKWFADLKFWKYSIIRDYQPDDENMLCKCIYIKDN